MEKEQSIVCVVGMNTKKRRAGKCQRRMMRMSNQVKPGRKNRLFLDLSPWLKSESIHIFYVLLRSELKEFGACLLLYMSLFTFCTFSC